MRKRSRWFALLFILTLVLYGCGRQAASGTAAQSTADAGTAAAPRGSAEAELVATGAAPSSNQAAVTSVKVKAAAADLTVQVTDRKIIQNAEVELHVRDVDEALAAIDEAVRSAGGYVQQNDVSGTRESGRRVQIILRVPAGNYGSVLDLLSGLGERTHLRQWTNDVTEEYLDLEARIATGEAHLAQLNKLYERSGTVTEMIELEREIARVTADLESLKGRYNFLANQVAYSTITVTMYEPGVPTPARTPQTLGERMRDGFLFSWNSTIAAAESLLVALVSLIPTLLFLAVLVGIIGVPVWLVVRRRRRSSTGSGAGGSGGDGTQQ